MGKWKSWSAALVMGAAVTLAGCKDKPSAVTPEAGVADGPAIWLLQDEDSRIWLFGTVHMLPKDVEWQSETVMAAFNEAEIVYFEADVNGMQQDPETQAMLQREGMNPDGVTLSSLMSEEDWDVVVEGANVAGMPPQMIEPMKPWMASLTVSVMHLVQQGYYPNLGVDTVLNRMATEQGKELGFLEDGMGQMAIFYDMPMEDQLDMLVEGARYMVDVPDYMSDLTTAWKTGNAEELNVSAQMGLADMSDDFYQAIMVDRNADWTNQIVEMMEGEGDIFIAVGAFHLVGDDSVQAMLEERGYTAVRQ